MCTTSSQGRRRPQDFTLPDGKKVVVTLSEDLETLRRKYDKDDEVQVEVVVYGSSEHANYLRQTRDHHKCRRTELFHHHGSTIDKWQDIQQQLSSATAELERISTQTSSIGDDFSKFGYHAELHTYEDEGDETALLRAYVSNTDGDPPPAKTIKLFKKPVIKQWFHRGLLWRASEQTEIMAIELFFDLLYAGIITINGEHMSEDADAYQLLRFVVTFIMSWKIWTDLTLTLGWFEADDVLTRLEILLAMALLLAFTSYMISSFNEDPSHNTWLQLVSFYLAARFLGALHYAVTAFTLPMVRGVMICQVITILIPSTLWIGTIHVEMPGRLALIWPALCLDLFGQIPYIVLFRYGRKAGDSSKLGRKLSHLFDFYPALSIEHRVERMDSFIVLVLGYSVVGIIFHSAGGYNVNAFLGKAILGLTQAFIINWIYFDIDASNLALHAIRRSAPAAILWQFAHLPFVMGYIIAISALSTLVLVADVPNCNAEQLAEPFLSRSAQYFSSGTRFFYCQGMAVTLLSMGAIALSHDHRVPATLRWPKPYRLANRLVACIIMFFLPMAQSLRSLDVISITVGLFAWVLIVEIWGKSCNDDSFIRGKDGCCVRYECICSKKDVLNATSPQNSPMRSADVMEPGKGEMTAM